MLFKFVIQVFQLIHMINIGIIASDELIKLLSWKFAIHRLVQEVFLLELADYNTDNSW